MDPKQIQDLLQIVMTANQNKGWTVAEMIGVVTAAVVCLVTTYGFIRSVINAGLDILKIQNNLQNETLAEQKVVLKDINSTLTTIRTDYVTHDVCSKRQSQLCGSLGLKDIKERITKLEDRNNK